MLIVDSRMTQRNELKIIFPTQDQLTRIRKIFAEYKQSGITARIEMQNTVNLRSVTKSSYFKLQG